MDSRNTTLPPADIFLGQTTASLQNYCVAYGVLPSPNRQLTASPPTTNNKKPPAATYRTDCSLHGVSPNSILYHGVLAEMAGTDGGPPTLWIHCLCRPSFLITSDYLNYFQRRPFTKYIQSIDDVVALVWGLPGGIPRLRRRKKI